MMRWDVGVTAACEEELDLTVAPNAAWIMGIMPAEHRDALLRAIGIAGEMLLTSAASIGDEMRVARACDENGRTLTLDVWRNAEQPEKGSKMHAVVTGGMSGKGFTLFEDFVRMRGMPASIAARVGEMETIDLLIDTGMIKGRTIQEHTIAPDGTLDIHLSPSARTPLKEVVAHWGVRTDDKAEHTT